jgi:hypothetical protein
MTATFSSPLAVASACIARESISRLVLGTAPTFTTGITVNGAINSTGTTNIQSAVNVDSLMNVTSTGTGTSYFQLISAGGGNAVQTDATGNLNFTANGVVAGVMKMIHAGAVANSLYVAGGGVNVGTAASTGSSVINSYLIFSMPFASSPTIEESMPSSLMIPSAADLKRGARISALSVSPTLPSLLSAK